MASIASPRDADVLVHCCYMASAEIENEHFRRVAQHTLAAGDSVGKIAARANAKTLVLTHHRPRKDERMLEELAARWRATSPDAS